MARREITMNEIIELIYQWHQGAGFQEHSAIPGV